MRLKHKCYFLFLIFILLNPSSSLAEYLDIRFSGYTQSCTENRTYNKVKANPCCIPCGCTDVCKERDTCCHDKEGRNDTKIITKQECMQPLYVPEGEELEKNVSSYYVRTKCPATYKNKNISVKIAYQNH